MRNLILIAFFCFGLLGVSFAQPTAFKDGERLTYVAEYKVSIINVEVATIDITTKATDYKGQKSFKINALAKTLPSYNWFFEMRDEYSVWVDHSTLKPIYFENSIREGSYTLESNYVYNWDKMVVNTYENRPVWKEPKLVEMAIKENSLDAVSLFFNLRNVDVDELEVGKAYHLDIVFANRIRTVGYKFLGREDRRIRGLGKLGTLKFICQLANDSGESFNDGDEFNLWLSDDKNKIPLYVESPIRVGSIRARLKSYENLVEPLK